LKKKKKEIAPSQGNQTTKKKKEMRREPAKGEPIFLFKIVRDPGAGKGGGVQAGRSNDQKGKRGGGRRFPLGGELRGPAAAPPIKGPAWKGGGKFVGLLDFFLLRKFVKRPKKRLRGGGEKKP